MAVDANVLIFERIREELKSGKSPKSAIDAGFKKAFWTIFDSNLTTVISAVFLFQFGTGPIKGYAITLIIGIAASMFTAIFVSRVIFDLTYGRRKKLVQDQHIGAHHAIIQRSTQRSSSSIKGITPSPFRG